MGIEKIGLPAKPAAKGASWVLDASSCQTCQTPFSLFNRKHHCRRCGGIFCGNCSSSKAFLRGQGDTAVRVCEPCKKLEEAARFQARQRGRKGALKGSSMAEDDALVKEVLGDSMHSLISGGSELVGDEDDGHHGIAEVSPSKDKIIELREENTSPEKLREQATEQKKVYSTLKREGKNAEALQAFKRHKELSREADALELSLKKLAISQRKAQAEAIASTDGPVQDSNRESPESAKDTGSQSSGQERAFSRHVAAAKKSTEDGGDEDLVNALKDLGWKEADLSEKKVKKGPTSDMDLLAEISDSLPKDESKKKPVKQSPTQLEILAHKRRALALKREGKPAEAKEELKQAKLLERKLEEMAVLEDEDEDEDDDDELAALMRSLNKEASMGTGKNSKLTPTEVDVPLSFSLAEDDDDPNVDVTDDDIHDPSIIAALRSMGWEEEAANMERSRDPQTGGSEAFHIAESVAKESSLQSEILTHKRRALALKREGKVAEAKIELQEAKGLEQKLDALKSQPISSQPSRATTAATSKPTGGPKGPGAMRLEDLLEDVDDGVEVDEDDMRDPDMMAALKAMGFEEEEPPSPLQTIVKPSPLEKKNLQDEVLSIKRSALALKKQGRVQEAREELRQAKILEQKLEKMQQNLEANGVQPATSMAKLQQRKGQTPISPLPLAGFVSEDEEGEVEVGADDFMDPELVAALKSVGWQEEDTFVKDKQPEKEEGIAVHSVPIPVQPYKAVKLPPKDHARKLQLQKELLAHKRRALALKREGKVEEAELELKQGKVLEKEMQDIDNAASDAGQDLHKESVSQSKQSIPAVASALGDESDDEDEDVTDEDMQDPELLNALKAFGWKPEPEKPADRTDKNTLPEPSKAKKAGLEKKDQSSGHKLDVTNPPYTKTATEPTVDPIWHAIMKSASMNNSEVPEKKTEETKREHSLSHDPSFEGEYGEIGSSTDFFPPLFDHPSFVQNAPVSVSGQGPSFDLLSGEVWDAPTGNVLEKDDSEEEDDVFDSGLLAALQSIGLGPPNKDSSSVQLRGDAAANVKRQGNNQQLQDTGSGKSGGRQQYSSVLEQTTNAGPVASSASGRQDKEGSIGRSPVRSKPIKSVSSDHDATFVFNEAAVQSSNNHAPTPSTAGGANPSLQEDIRSLKRNALALKREGKNSEAREELRRAKILEKQLEADTQSSTEEHQSPDGLSKSAGTPSSASPEKLSQTESPDKSQAASSHAQTHKEQVRQELRQGKDRKKLQQESLAHKRKALGLRREGKMDEADAEFELAKTLEKQMEDLDVQSGKAVAQDPSDMGMVEDLLDPQLMAALKGLGFNDGALHGSANVNRASVGPSNLNRGNQPPDPQAVKSSTNRLPNTSHIIVNERIASQNSQESQLKDGTSTSTTSSGNKAKEERIAYRNTQPIQSTGARSTSGSIGASYKPEEERDVVRRGSQRMDPAPEVGRSSKGGASSRSASASQAERTQLEDRIKREKVKAVELKRGGRQGEALEVLRGAKRLEKELLAMPS